MERSGVECASKSGYSRDTLFRTDNAQLKKKRRNGSATRCVSSSGPETAAWKLEANGVFRRVHRSSELHDRNPSKTNLGRAEGPGFIDTYYCSVIVSDHHSPGYCFKVKIAKKILGLLSIICGTYGKDHQDMQ